MINSFNISDKKNLIGFKIKISLAILAQKNEMFWLEEQI